MTTMMTVPVALDAPEPEPDAGNAWELADGPDACISPAMGEAGYLPAKAGKRYAELCPCGQAVVDRLIEVFHDGDAIQAEYVAGGDSEGAAYSRFYSDVGRAQNRFATWKRRGWTCPDCSPATLEALQREAYALAATGMAPDAITEAARLAAEAFLHDTAFARKEVRRAEQEAAREAAAVAQANREAAHREASVAAAEARRAAWKQ